MAKTASEEIIPILRETHLLLQKAGAYDRVMAFLKRKNAYPVVFLGASGAGKTALLRSLVGLPSNIRREDRTDEVQAVKKKLGESYIEVIDTPGEEEHKSKRDVFFRELLKRKSVGVVNVVSFGYHEGNTAQAIAVDGQKVSESFLAARRQVEIKRAAEWVGPISGRGGCVSWILTVATKADLWWEAGADQPVLQYYGSKPYMEAFSASDEVPHSVKSYSSLNHLFYDKAPMSGFYSDARRAEDHKALLSHLLDKASEHG